MAPNSKNDAQPAKRGRPRKSTSGSTTNPDVSTTPSQNPPPKRGNRDPQVEQEQDPEDVFRAHRDSERNPALERINATLRGKQTVLQAELEEARRREKERAEEMKRMLEELNALKAAKG